VKIRAKKCKQDVTSG